jgi:trigger factor
VKVTLERLPESRVQLDIEVDEERLERSLDSAYRRVAQKARIPGFRPGKAPRRIVEQMIGRDGLIREALDKLVPDVYNEAIEAESVEAVDQPDLELLELDPVRFKATVSVRPTVDLGDYKAVRVAANPVDVTGEMVQEQIDQIRRRFATQVPVERAVQWDDVVLGDVHATIDDEPFVDDDDAEFLLREGQDLLIPGLAGAFLGMKESETKEFELGVPEDFHVEKFKGKTAKFTLTVKGVKEEQLPDADDELAAQVNEEEFDSFEKLRERVASDLLERGQRAEDARIQQEALDLMVEGATLEYPRVFVEREIDHMVEETVGNDRNRYLDYLGRLGQTEAQFRDEFEEPATKRVERSLVMSNLAEAESIEVTAEDIEARLDQLVQPAGDEAARLRQLFATPDGVASIRRNLLSERTLAHIREIATAPLEKKPRRKAAAKAGASASAEEAEPAAEIEVKA